MHDYWKRHVSAISVLLFFETKNSIRLSRDEQICVENDKHEYFEVA